MKRRFWISLAVGAVVSGTAVLGFGPYVRGSIADKAERYGAAVQVGQVTPSWGGVRLSGVDVTIAEVPGVSVRLDQVVVSWTGKRLVSMAGGRIDAVGSVPSLVAAVDSWRTKRLSGGSGKGGGRKLSLEGFAVEWRNTETDPSWSVKASDVDIGRDSGALSVAAARLDATLGGHDVSVSGGRLVLQRGDGGYRVKHLASEALMLNYRGSKTPLLGPNTALLDGGTGEEASNGDKAKPAQAKPEAVHGRVLAARAIRARLVAAAARLDAIVDADALVEVRGARARLSFGTEALNLGPGTLSLTRDAADLVVALRPQVDARPDTKALTFSLRVPLHDADASAAERAVEAHLMGGPVWLSMLGVQDGDLGLKDVSQASFEADVRVVLPPDGASVAIDGRGKLHGLSLFNERLAAAPLEGVELAWRSKLDAQLDGSYLRIHEAEVNLGDLRGLARGSYERRADTTKLDLTYDIPLVTCQQVFESIPGAMVPKLQGMRFVGSLAMKGHARFDTKDLMRHYDVGWDGAMSCRIVEVPPDIQVSRLNSSFVKLVYSPTKEERSQTFGPDTESWVPLSEISHFMTGAVLTTEDGRYFRHHGFDQEAIVNSIRDNLREKRFVRGASTISMQLAKNLYLPRTKTIARKLQEAVLTLYLEQALTKNEMMELYLNIIEYGPNIYGIGPAARHYFNSHPSKLSLGQCLYLASILSNPKKQYFGAGGAVIPSRMGYLRMLMKIVHKIGRISDEELERGLRETVMMGGPSLVAPAEDDVYAEDESAESTDGFVDPWSG